MQDLRLFEHTAESRPDFSAPIYAAMHVVDMSEMPEDPMPLFIAVTGDDVFGFQNQSLDLYSLWNEAGETAELHVYSQGGHGFGMRKQHLTSDHWIDQFEAWLISLGFL